jgi:putative ABC transport system permease protein
VLGSSSWEVFAMFAKDFSIQVLAGNLVAIPIVWFVMDQWLSSFAERITIGVGVFAATMAVTFLSAMITISYHSWKSANLNPARALRAE